MCRGKGLLAPSGPNHWKYSSYINFDGGTQIGWNHSWTIFPDLRVSLFRPLVISAISMWKFVFLPQSSYRNYILYISGKCEGNSNPKSNKGLSEYRIDHINGHIFYSRFLFSRRLFWFGIPQSSLYTII